MKAQGAVFGEVAGWERPNWFADSDQDRAYRYDWSGQNWFENNRTEHMTVREGVGLFEAELAAFKRLGGRIEYACPASELLVEDGRVAGVPLRPARDRHTLSRALRELRGRRIYIDTAGVGPRDQRLLGQLELVQSQRVKLQSLLVLSASAQPAQSRLIASRFRGRQVSGAIITKVDETLSLGGVIDVLARGALPLHSVGDGQAVPGDLRAVDPQWLLRRALELARDTQRPQARAPGRRA